MGLLERRKRQCTIQFNPRIGMKGSSLDFEQALYSKLVEIPAIVTGFQQRNGQAEILWQQWLKDTEDILFKYNCVECASLAGFRADILAAKADPECTGTRKSTTSRILKTINPAQSIVVSVHNRVAGDVGKVRVFFKQILTQAKTAGVLKCDDSSDFTSFIEGLLKQFRFNEQLAPSVNNAVATLGYSDVIRLLAEETSKLI